MILNVCVSEALHIKSPRERETPDGSGASPRSVIFRGLFACPKLSRSPITGPVFSPVSRLVLE